MFVREDLHGEMLFLRENCIVQLDVISVSEKDTSSAQIIGKGHQTQITFTSRDILWHKRKQFIPSAQVSQANTFELIKENLCDN